MPRGVYDRSKIKRKSNKNTKSAVKFSASEVVEGNSGDTETQDVRLMYLERCTSILNDLSSINTQSATEARVGIVRVVNEIVSSMITAVTPGASDLVVATTAQTTESGAIATGTVKLKKDGTPRRRPGPKPRAETQVVERSPAASSGNGAVFNPEHAGQ